MQKSVAKEIFLILFFAQGPSVTILFFDDLILLLRLALRLSLPGRRL